MCLRSNLKEKTLKCWAYGASKDIFRGTQSGSSLHFITVCPIIGKFKRHPHPWRNAASMSSHSPWSHSQNLCDYFRPTAVIRLPSPTANTNLAPTDWNGCNRIAAWLIIRQHSRFSSKAGIKGTSLWGSLYISQCYKCSLFVMCSAAHALR